MQPRGVFDMTAGFSRPEGGCFGFFNGHIRAVMSYGSGTLHMHGIVVGLPRSEMFSLPVSVGEQETRQCVHCGALNSIEPMKEVLQRLICHFRDMKSPEHRSAPLVLLRLAV